MPLGPGTRLGPYEILAAIGAGGMGEVYRARDTRLKRDVALKILPESFAANPERLARFQREAEVLASLNHPHIAQIYGIEESNGTRALVMELVEGETLADRVARGAISVDEALPIATQIAEALEAAHEQGIIHRDLKPANIKVRPDGTVKVLDFGLAKLSESANDGRPAVTGPSLSPTITSPGMMTGIGVLLGTAAYMSPEQAKGRAADKRSDIWAFGCVLYEMLTGKRPFDGEDVTDVLVAVLGKEPADLSALPVDVPVAIRTLLRRCLEKDRRRRIADISTALFTIDEVATLGTAAGASSPAIAVRQVPLWRRLAIYTLPALLGGAAVAGGVVWFATRPLSPRVSRLTIATRPATAIAIYGVERDLAITPDGFRVIYSGNAGGDLFIQPVDALEPMRLFTGAPRGPFVSPDSQWVGFIDGNNLLKKVAITGGPAITIAALDGNSRGTTWTSIDTIVFATNSAATGLQQVSATGGQSTILTRPDRSHGEADHLWPEPLPGDRAVLFTVVPINGGIDAAQIAVLDRQTGTQKVVLRGGSHAHYVNSGHLVYAAGNTLRAVAFDPVTLQTQGTPVPVVSEVVTTAGGGVDAVVANDGTLAYVRGLSEGAGPRTITWIDRQGRETPIGAPPRAYTYPRISPEGDRVVAWSNDQDSDLWLWSVIRQTLTRLTFNSGIDNYPIWAADGRRLLFSSDREGGERDLFSQSADGTGAVERLTRGPNLKQTTGVSLDGTRLIFTETAPTTGEDVMQVELTGSHTVIPLVQTAFAERNGIVSPDGRWLAYEANDSGQVEIYVRPYPDVKSGRWQVSTGGGTRPLWSHDGEELFYVSPTGAILRVRVERGASWAATTPAVVVKEGYWTILAGSPGRSYDISRDGQRFLVLKATNDPNTPPPQLVVVQHFDEELKRLVPAK